jgi:hypothetical protein
MQTVKIKNQYWDIAANILFPPDFREPKKYPAIISGHPIGSCKEQTSGKVYGSALAKEASHSTPVSKATAAANLAPSKIQHDASTIFASSPII